MTGSQSRRVQPATSSIKVGNTQFQGRIHVIRDVQVMLDSDLAELYGVSTSALNQAVKRNLDRFPVDFMFQVTQGELDQCQTPCVDSGLAGNLKSQSVTSSSTHGGRRRSLPYAFTEQGVAMLSSVLRSERAIQVNIAIMRAFVELRRWARGNEELARKLSALERKSDEQYRQVMRILEKLVQPPAPSLGKIGFPKPPVKPD